MSLSKESKNISEASAEVSKNNQYIASYDKDLLSLEKGLYIAKPKANEIFGDDWKSFLRIFDTMVSYDGMKEIYIRIVENKNYRPDYFSLPFLVKGKLPRYMERPLYIFNLINGKYVSIRENISDVEFLHFLNTVLKYVEKTQPIYKTEINSLAKKIIDFTEKNKQKEIVDDSGEKTIE